uniref:Myb-like domain-containing protein n=1 Tax=Globodera pallida TaxID=36090 RepID=A0A183CKM0_GLOPA
MAFPSSARRPSLGNDFFPTVVLTSLLSSIMVTSVQCQWQFAPGPLVHNADSAVQIAARGYQPPPTAPLVSEGEPIQKPPFHAAAALYQPQQRLPHPTLLPPQAPPIQSQQPSTALYHPHFSQPAEPFRWHPFNTPPPELDDQSVGQRRFAAPMPFQLKGALQQPQHGEEIMDQQQNNNDDNNKNNNDNPLVINTLIQVFSRKQTAINDERREQLRPAIALAEVHSQTEVKHTPSRSPSTQPNAALDALNGEHRVTVTRRLDTRKRTFLPEAAINPRATPGEIAFVKAFAATNASHLSEAELEEELDRELQQSVPLILEELGKADGKRPTEVGEALRRTDADVKIHPTLSPVHRPNPTEDEAGQHRRLKPMRMGAALATAPSDEFDSLVGEGLEELENNRTKEAKGTTAPEGTTKCLDGTSKKDRGNPTNTPG